MAKKSKESKTSSKKKGLINGAKKGKAFERDVSNALGHIWPAAERMLEYQASGNVGVDIQGTGIFKIQCKRNAGYAPISRINEVRTRDDNDIPVLVTKGNRMDAMAVLPFDKFIYLLEIVHGISGTLERPDDDGSKEIFRGEESEKSDTFKRTSYEFMGLPVIETNTVGEDELRIYGETKAGSKDAEIVKYEKLGTTGRFYIQSVMDKIRLRDSFPKEIHCLHVGYLKKVLGIEEGKPNNTKTDQVQEPSTIDGLI